MPKNESKYVTIKPFSNTVIDDGSGDPLYKHFSFELKESCYSETKKRLLDYYKIVCKECGQEVPDRSLYTFWCQSCDIQEDKITLDDLEKIEI
ncbi:MAG: hypothetical protein ACE5J4_02595 [Candidatus Aenigmatarchaeota archaeon]